MSLSYNKPGIGFYGTIEEGSWVMKSRIISGTHSCFDCRQSDFLTCDTISLLEGQTSQVKPWIFWHVVWTVICIKKGDILNVWLYFSGEQCIFVLLQMLKIKLLICLFKNTLFMH